MKKIILLQCFIACVCMCKADPNITIKGSNFGVITLAQGTQAFSNRTNMPLGEIPTAYSGWSFVKINANSSYLPGPLPSFKIKADADGYFYAMVADVEKPEICSKWATDNGWELISGPIISYGSTNASKFHVYKKACRENQWVYITQPVTFSGAVIIAPAITTDNTYYKKVVEGSYSVRLVNTNTFLTQNNGNGISAYYAAFLNTDGVKNDASRFSNTTVNDYNWTFTFSNSDQGCLITNKNGYMTSEGYIHTGEGSSNNTNMFTLWSMDDGDSLFAIQRQDGSYFYPSYNWDNSNKVNTITTQSTPQFWFVLDNKVLTDTLDENGTFVPDGHGVGFLTLKRGLKLNSWNTICLPFTRSIDAITTLFGSDSELATFVGGDEDVLNFTTGADSLKANVPYLLKPTSMATDSLYTLQDVELSGDGASTVTTDNYSFIGTYSKEILPDVYYIYSNAFYHSTDEFTVTIKPFRCYFTAVNSSAKALSINIDGNGETTGIMKVTPDQSSFATEVYNLNGQCLRKGVFKVSELPKGLYIVNGKKVIISH